MATYHLSCKRLQRSQGHSASGCAAYRTDSLLIDPWDGRRYDQRARHDGEDPEHFFVGPAGFDTEVSIPEFFAGVDANERRKDATVGKEYTAALPLELSRHESREIARSLAHHFADEGRVASVAIHFKDQNPHAHVWVSDRTWTPNGWGEKVKKWDQPKHLLGIREAFAEIQNQAYARAGLECRVDHRSHRDRGLDYEPEKHEGRAPTDAVLDHNARIAAQRVAAFELEREAAEAEMAELAIALAQVEATRAQIEHEEAERVEGELRLAALEQKAAAAKPQFDRFSMRGAFAMAAAPVHPADRVAQAHADAGKAIQPETATAPRLRGADAIVAAEQAASRNTDPSRLGSGRKSAWREIPAVPSPPMTESEYGPR